MQLTDDEVKTVVAALEIARECIESGLKEPEVVASFTPTQLAEHEEAALKFADLLERFKRGT